MSLPDPQEEGEARGRGQWLGAQRQRREQGLGLAPEEGQDRDPEDANAVLAHRPLVATPEAVVIGQERDEGWGIRPIPPAIGASRPFQELVDGPLRGRRVHPYQVERIASFRADREDGVRNLEAVGPVPDARVVVGQHGLGDPLVASVLAGRTQLLFVAPVRGALLAGVRLPDDDVEEPGPTAVPFVGPFSWRDGAGGERSGEAAEAQQVGSPAAGARAVETRPRSRTEGATRPALWSIPPKDPMPASRRRASRGLLRPDPACDVNVAQCTTPIP
jgi:hypothetical protein